MPDPVQHATLASYFGMAAAFFGFAGSMIILWATWGTIGLRKTILEAGEVHSKDPNIVTGLVVVKGLLNQEQIKELNCERWLYFIGSGLLAIGFILAFVREWL